MTAAHFEPLDEQQLLRVLGERLREHRLRHGLSLLGVESATAGEITHGSLGAYERGTRTISVVKLLELAHLYRTPVHELLAPARQGSGPDRRSAARRAESVSPVIELSTAAVHRADTADIGPVQRLLTAVDPHRRLASFVLTPEQVRHLSVLYRTTAPGLAAMFTTWGVLRRPHPGRSGAGGGH